MSSRARIVAVAAAVALFTGGTAAVATAASTSSPNSPAAARPAGIPADGRPTGPGGKHAPAPGTPDPQVCAALARVMGISRAQAAEVLLRLDATVWSSGRRVSASDPHVQALAADLHLSASRLVHDLVRMKQILAQGMPAPSPSPSAPSLG